MIIKGHSVPANQIQVATIKQMCGNYWDAEGYSVQRRWSSVRSSGEGFNWDSDRLRRAFENQNERQCPSHWDLVSLHLFLDIPL